MRHGARELREDLRASRDRLEHLALTRSRRGKNRGRQPRDRHLVRLHRPRREIDQDTAAAPRPVNPIRNEDRDQISEPSRLNATREPRSITEVNGKGDGLGEIAPDDDATADTANDSSLTAAATWSIWPPLLTAGTGLIALLGFSFSLRRRTQSGWQRSTLPRTEHESGRAVIAPAQMPTPAQTRTIPVAMSPNVAPQLPKHPASDEAHFNNVPQTQVLTQTQQQPTQIQTSAKPTLLEALINNQLPMTEEKVAFVSPLQFHGRPAAPRNQRLDERHELPKPHAPSLAPQPTHRPTEPMNDLVEVAAQTVSYGETQKFRVDQSSSATTKPASRFAPAKRAAEAMQHPAATVQKTKSVNPSSTPHSAVTSSPVASSRRPVAVSENASGPLDRALLAVQKREERS